MKRVKSFGVLQTSIVAAIIYFLIFAVIMIPLGIIMSLTGLEDTPGFPFGGAIFFILMPFIYGIFGFVFTAISCVIYNLIAKWTGGIEVEVETIDHPINH